MVQHICEHGINSCVVAGLPVKSVAPNVCAVCNVELYPIRLDQPIPEGEDIYELQCGSFRYHIPHLDTPNKIEWILCVFCDVSGHKYHDFCIRGWMLYSFSFHGTLNLTTLIGWQACSLIVLTIKLWYYHMKGMSDDVFLCVWCIGASMSIQ